MEVLPKRLGKYGLTLHPEKTRLIDLDEEKGKDKHPKKTFDFLGFTYYMSKSRKSNCILKRKTSSKKLVVISETEIYALIRNGVISLTELNLL